ncbi:GNAT family N-acetyltransferase [Alicyclobacillus dauci]|uniref:GNAT family N-acetyltransferase n=1 Tax=Alicyclobacillus dauci TaxID=1475485 RepID=A0ABY6Z6H2_9BACL|nr:GNAT family N-acetyltransferase [Alicyclobacillus dauci]WAH38494.1 GNAT family N-acetyltransferase [Alicyclobacillus dauci]
MVITQATVEDAEEILQLQKRAFRIEAEAYGNFDIIPLVETVDQTIDDFASKLILKAVDDGKIVGSVRGHQQGGTCYVGRLIVDPAVHNRGIGTQLLTALESHFPGCRFELYTGYRSDRNIHLYEKLGYRKYKVVYSDEENIDFVYMEKIGPQVE